MEPLKCLILGGSNSKPGYCSPGGTAKTKADNWNGRVLDVSLNADDYGISNIHECMKKACLPHKDCIAAGWRSGAIPLCYVWKNCDFDNLQGVLPHYTLKRGKIKFIHTIWIVDTITDDHLKYKIF